MNQVNTKHRSTVVVEDIVITESRPGELVAAMHEAATPELEFVFATRAAEPSDLVLVAWLGVQAVGYLAATQRGEPGGGAEIEVWEHAVLPDHRFGGIGRTLLYELARRSPARALIRVDPAHQLDLERIADYYTACGFTHHRSGASGEEELYGSAGEVLRATGHGLTGPRGVAVSTLLGAKEDGVVTVGPEASVGELVALLNRHRIGAVPVSRDGSRVEGIVSERDILHGLDGESAAELMERSVADVMTPDVVTCTASDGIELVMSLMTRLRIRHIPVTEGGKLIGMVSIGDVVAQRLEVLEEENRQIREYIVTGR
ncbi:MAG: GNAT family N-acetyltransferase [Acidimicrobiales bacterium]